MRVFLYEWITGGGLVEQQSSLPQSLLAEGAAMIHALAEDFVRVKGCEVTVLRDARLTELEFRDCRVIEVHSTADWREEFDRLASTADYTLVVAPEFDDLLKTTVGRITAAGGRALNASQKFIDVAADKQQTVDRLQAAALPVPGGIVIDADDPKLPKDFQYPGVLKPVVGAGSQHMFLVEASSDEPPPYPWQRRLERFYQGRPASVAAICGPAGMHLLPPCWQTLSHDGRFSYRGGAIIRDEALAKRASSLGAQALAAMPPPLGYVGVDLILADASDASEDVVVEINPRVTTSYVGLRAAVTENIAQAMLDVARGNSAQFTLSNAAIAFASDGSVWTDL
jgi:predicted ATP-grasp superfamily ATP-dependent carboligase